MAKKTDVIENVLAPVKRVNEASIESVEKLLDTHVAVLRRNSEYALNAWRGALEVRDLDSARQYLESQTDVAKAMMTDAMADAKTVAGIGRDYVEAVRTVYGEQAGIPGIAPVGKAA